VSFLDFFEGNNIKPKWVHVGNSAGYLKVIDDRINAFRPGIALYGINPLNKNDTEHKKLRNLKPVLRVVSTVTDVQEVRKGDCVGYGCTYTAKKKTKIGLLPIGYNEVLDRRLSGKGFVKFKNNFLPIVGNISMMMTSFKIGSANVKSGDEVIVISELSKDKNSIENIAEMCDTIPYEILVRISSNIRRVIV